MTPNSASTLIAGKYEVLQALDTCATGGALKVRHALLGTEFALTILAAPSAGAQDVVRRASLLRHDHIVPVVDLFEADGVLHVVEALVDAEPLAARLAQQGALAPVEALRLVRQLADALTQAHEAGLVHGALTSSCVLVERGAATRAVLTGLASTALAASPETDARADVFALGCLLFEMLEATSLLTDDVRTGDAPIVPRYSRIAPTGVPALVGRAVRRRPEDRFQTMAGMRTAIDACLQYLGQTVATPATASAAATASGRPVRRIVLDEALLDDLGEGGDVPEEAPAMAMPGTRMKELLLAKAARHAGRPTPAPAPAPARPVVVKEGGRRRSSGRVVAVAGAIMGAVAVLALVLGWPRRESAAPAPVAGSATMSEPAAGPSPAALVVPVEEAPVHPASAAEAPVAEMRAAFEAAVDEAAPAPAAPERNLAPRIVRQQPAARNPIRVAEGQSVELAVYATDRNDADRLAYTWFVDGEKQKPARGARWRLTAPHGSAGATRTVEVQVADRGGLRTPRVTWRVDVTARMSEANVHDWLMRLALAYERKDTATLRLFGLITTEGEATAIRKRVPWFGGYHVTAVNPTVHLDREHASVAFDRVETDGGGKVIRSAREAYQLEKQPSGFVGLR